MKHAVARGLHCVFGVDHHRKALVVDHDQIERILGDIATLGHHHGDRFAHMADAADGDAALLDRRVCETRQWPGGLGNVGAGQNLNHARQCRRGGDIDRLDAGVGARAAQHRRVQHVGKVDVVDIAALPCQQSRILDALNALADPLQLLARLLALTAGRNRRRRLDDRVHHAASLCAATRSSSAARSTATMMF